MTNCCSVVLKKKHTKNLAYGISYWMTRFICMQLHWNKADGSKLPRNWRYFKCQTIKLSRTRTENQDDMTTKTAQNSWVRKNDQSVCAWKGFEATDRERACQGPEVTRGRKTYISWLEIYRRKNKQTLPAALKKNKIKFAVNFDRYPTLKFS